MKETLLELSAYLLRPKDPVDHFGQQSSSDYLGNRDFQLDEALSECSEHAELSLMTHSAESRRVS